MTEKPGIYCIRHCGSGRVYVGSAGNFSKRWHAHRKALRTGSHRNQHLQAAWSKYGEAAFDFEILEFTRDFDAREQHWMDTLEAYAQGFNLCPIARSSRGRVASPEEVARRRVLLDRIRGEAVTPEAIARRVARRRRDGTLNQKLCWQDVVAIRAAYGKPTKQGRGCERSLNRGVTLSSLARGYNVSAITIYDVIKWKTWKTNPHQSPE